jgi:hypothetical protein
LETKKIFEVEESLRGALEALPAILLSNPSNPSLQQLVEARKILAPTGYQLVVELHEKGRRKRRTASADNWTPDSGEILISFRKDDSPRQMSDHPGERALPTIRTPQGRTDASPLQPEAATVRPQSSSASPYASSPEPQEKELCRALEEVERQGRAFIALRWFRENVLPATGFTWAADAAQRQSVLTSAIAKGLITTSRIPNPRSSFPTTAIRLNRASPTPHHQGQRYSPVQIQGNSLSSTILRDRGTY